MADDPDYISLSKRFESLAERASDRLLAEAYRKLALTYRALDYWHERFKRRYETSSPAPPVGDADADAHFVKEPRRDDR
jgi:hypothetical protein